MDGGGGGWGGVESACVLMSVRPGIHLRTTLTQNKITRQNLGPDGEYGVESAGSSIRFRYLLTLESTRRPPSRTLPNMVRISDSSQSTRHDISINLNLVLFGVTPTWTLNPVAGSTRHDLNATDA